MDSQEILSSGWIKFIEDGRGGCVADAVKKRRMPARRRIRSRIKSKGLRCTRPSAFAALVELRSTPISTAHIQGSARPQNMIITGMSSLRGLLSSEEHILLVMNP